MNILVLGGGSIGKRHIKNLISALNSKENIYVVEPQKERQEEIKSFGIPSNNIFSSREECLRTKRFDGAIIATPTSLHYEDAFAIAEHGCNLMIEKPLGVDSKGAQKLKNLISQNKIFAFTAYCFRFNAVAAKFKQLIQEEFCGKPLYARAEMSTYLPDWHPHEDYRKFYMAKKNLGGGTLLDQSHLYDLAMWFFGDIQSVLGVTTKYSNLEIETDDFGEFIFKMRSKLMVSVHVDLFTRPFRESFMVTCEKGTLIWDIHTRQIFFDDINNKREILFEGSDYNEMYVNEMIYFIDQVKQKGTLEGPHFDQGKRVVEIIDAIRRSSELKSWVDV